MFRSEDGGATWEPLPGLNDNAQYRAWMGDEQGGTPDGPVLHSIIVDPRGPGAPLHGHVQRRRARVARPRPDVEPAGAGDGGGGGLRRGQHRLPRPALRPDVARQPGPPVPAEPLRHLPAGPPGEGVDPRRQEHAEAGRRHRLPHRAPPARRRHRVGVPHGWLHGVAAHQPGREAVRVRHPRRREEVEAARPRDAGEARVVDGEAPGDGRRRAGPGRALLRDHQRRAVDEPRRGEEVGVHRPATCRRSTRWRPASAHEGDDSQPLALVHQEEGRRGAGGDPGGRCSPTSTASTPASGSG